MFCKVRKTLKEYREWQLKMYNRWEDTLEVRLAGISAAISKLEEQIKREATDRLHDDIRDNGDS